MFLNFFCFFFFFPPSLSLSVILAKERKRERERSERGDTVRERFHFAGERLRVREREREREGGRERLCGVKKGGPLSSLVFPPTHPYIFNAEINHYLGFSFEFQNHFHYPAGLSQEVFLKLQI